MGVRLRWLPYLDVMARHIQGLRRELFEKFFGDNVEAPFPHLLIGVFALSSKRGFNQGFVLQWEFQRDTFHICLELLHLATTQTSNFCTFFEHHCILLGIQLQPGMAFFRNQE